MNEECMNAIALFFFSVIALLYLAKKIVRIAKRQGQKLQAPMQDWFSPCNPNEKILISVIVFRVTLRKKFARIRA
jgi:hypothetical protein